MGWFSKSRTYSIGVDIAERGIKMAQLANGGQCVNLLAGIYRDCPDDIEPGSAPWQRWVIEALHEAATKHTFQGRDIIATIPSNDVYVDHLRIAKAQPGQIEDAIFSRVKQKLPFESARKDTMIKYVQTDDDYVLVMVAQRTVIDRHLAVYERAGLKIKSIAVWPVALANCYAKFFGRRKADHDSVVMLIDIQSSLTNIVVCRGRNVLFAGSIPMGARQLQDERMLTRLVLELTATRRRFASSSHNTRIDRLIFFSGAGIEKQTYATIARQMEIQAQVGDCLAAVEVPEPLRCGLDRRNGAGDANWATAFGLSLS